MNRPATMTPALRGHIMLAAVLLGVELISGVGLIGGVGLLVAVVMLVLYLCDRRASQHLLRAALIYTMLFVTTVAWSSFNWRIAERRAIPVIKACENYRSAHNRFQKGLDELVPEYMPSVPPAGLTLYVPIMFHGVVSYDFQSQTWRTNE